MEVVSRTIVLFVLAATTLLKIEGQDDRTGQDRDLDALRRLHKSLSDPGYVPGLWDASAINAPCSWPYVACNDFDRVTRLELPNKGLSGALVAELGNMDQLQYLLLQKNKLKGKIPESLGNLKNLIDMNLGDNAFEYNIPNFGANLQSLQFLQLPNNKLSGEIPKSLATIPKLLLLDVSNNRGLCGIAPIELLNIDFLRIGGNPGLGQSCPRKE